MLGVEAGEGHVQAQCSSERKKNSAIETQEPSSPKDQKCAVLSSFSRKVKAKPGEEDEREAKIFASSLCSSPPKNALILTRCRSAPFRSSSLACRFGGLGIS
ncbi:hypothetical protein V6N12_057354 [Hibiscus sabdariffa]|uniref:Uncharacterized protein n=1 Tax=Hibiscus sabdariffa TaxID=183260 RepID=A0ABR2DCJ3_9ROSI